MACPQCDKGKMVVRRTRKGRVFYACDKYPDCKYSLWNEPVAEKCPQCGFPLLVRKETKKEGKLLACSVKECGYKRQVESESSD